MIFSQLNDVIFIRHLQEKSAAKKKTHHVIVDLEKAFHIIEKSYFMGNMRTIGPRMTCKNNNGIVKVLKISWRNFRCEDASRLRPQATFVFCSDVGSHE